MAGRDEIERILTAAYAARKDGDLDVLSRIFSDTAQFRIAGTGPAATPATETRPFKHVLHELITVFEWLDVTILNLIIEGSRAAVHWRGTIRSTATGETVVTELVDIFGIENGRIASLTEFCDTALVARLVGGPTG